MPITELSDAVGNIGPSGRRQRLLVGSIALAAAVAWLLTFDHSGTSRWWRVGAFPLLWLGAVGILQARARTCIAFAARATCDPDAGLTELTTAVADQLRQRARTIVRLATLIAAVVTALALLL